MGTTTYELTDRFRLEEGTVFLSGVQALARLPATNCASTAASGSTPRRSPPGIRARPSARTPRNSSVPRRRSRPADRRRARRQRGARGDIGDGQPAGDDPRRRQIRRGRRHLVRQGPRIRPQQRRDPPRRVRRHVDARRGRRDRRRRPGREVVDRAVVERRDDGRPAHADPVPRRRPGGARPQPARGRAVAHVRVVGRDEAGHARSPTGPARSTCTRPGAPVRTGRRGRRQPFQPTRTAGCSRRTPSTWNASSSEVRSVLARQYGVDNDLNRISVRTGDDWIGIAACGHTYHELREALSVVGFRTDDDLRPRASGCSRLLMPVPLDPAQCASSRTGLEEVLVVEEKNPTLEGVIKSALYDGPHHPRVVGRDDEDGRCSSTATGRSTSTSCSPRCTPGSPAALADRMRPLDELVKPERPRIALTRQPQPVLLLGLPAQLEHARRAGHARRRRHRLPRDGRPHGPRTRRRPRRADPDGRRGRTVDRDRAVRRTRPPRPEPRRRDVLPLRLARGARRGGGRRRHHLQAALQRHRGDDRRSGPAGPDVGARRRQGLLSRGGEAGHRDQRRPRPPRPERLPGRRRHLGPQPARRGAADPRRDRRGHRAAPRSGVRGGEAPGAFAGHGPDTRIPSGHQRAGLRGVRRLRRQEQLPLRATRRHPVRPQDPDPPEELQLRPVVHARATARRSPPCRSTPPRTRQRALPAPPDAIADPRPALVDPDEFTVRFTGIGGTGVVTVSQILGTAAMLAGLQVRGLDQTGLSQKAGPVVSDIRVASATAPATNHASAAGVDSILAFDLLVGASDSNLMGAQRDRTVVIASTDAVPTGAMVTHPEMALPDGGSAARASRASQSLRRRTVTSTRPGWPTACSGRRRRRTCSSSAPRCRPARCRSRPTTSAGDRAERRGGRQEPRRVRLGAGVGRRPRRGRARRGLPVARPPESLDRD